MEYSALTIQEQLDIVRGRIVNEERQHYDLSLAIKVADNQGWATTNKSNLDRIEQRISTLRDEESQLLSQLETQEG